VVIPSILTSPAISGIWVILPSLTGDVVDYDELRTGERREGAFASIFSWILKLAWAIANGLAGPLVEIAGYRPEIRDALPAEVVANMRYMNALIPVFFLVPALILAARFPLTTQKIDETRRLLEDRRGVI
jgi:GPH family glycoside/pentoside/hexuronide:cation symporter